jgi:hypothetical protein
MSDESRLLPYGRQQQRLSGEFITDMDLALHSPDGGFAAQNLDGDDHLITRNNRTTQARLINSRQEGHIVFALFGSTFEQSEDRAGLRHRFNGENAWHDRRTRKMSVEERLIDRDVLQRDNSLVGIDFDDTIHQQKRIAMRKDPHDLGDAKLHFRI